MTIKRNTTRYIDLDGPDGNAFALMGLARSWLKQMERDPKPVMDEMKSGDYYNLVRVFEREFGEIVELRTNNEGLLEAMQANNDD